MFGSNGIGPHSFPLYTEIVIGMDRFEKRRYFPECVPTGSVLCKSIKYTEINENVRVYSDYEKIRHRKAFKDAAKAFKEGKVCLMCGSTKILCVHHNKYHTDPMDFSDAIVLCRDCHAKIHGRGQYA